MGVLGVAGVKVSGSTAGVYLFTMGVTLAGTRFIRFTAGQSQVALLLYFFKKIVHLKRHV